MHLTCSEKRRLIVSGAGSSASVAAGLYGGDLQEAATVDMLLEAVADLRAKLKARCHRSPVCPGVLTDSSCNARRHHHLQRGAARTAHAHQPTSMSWRMSCMAPAHLRKFHQQSDLHTCWIMHQHCVSIACQSIPCCLQQVLKESHTSVSFLHSLHVQEVWCDAGLSPQAVADYISVVLAPEQQLTQSDAPVSVRGTSW